MDEIWADIKGYEDLYQASNLGRIRSLDRVARHGHHLKGKLLSIKNSKNNPYQRVILYKDGVQKTFLVHRLVWEAFNGKIPDELVINHIDENPKNNSLDNLSLMTQKDNNNYGSHNERHSKALSKPVVGYDKDGNVVVKFKSMTDAGKNGFTPERISGCCLGLKRFKSHRGLYWKYADGDC